ncbi:hypothetical protein B0H17DRAFT_1064013 [Mycena rosella]|uniref:N-acetyltransferase domain-containing protein n=1 Tax=Mycena rosella TaxID=1033263 RepID=A0AAD7DG14_MYCRO|nr:hypothetical protein B0H17DRAFT_1064013 [Mycena rosella]
MTQREIFIPANAHQLIPALIMAEANPAVVDPRSSSGPIIVRQFRPQDAPQVHALLIEGFAYGPESPCNTALRRNWSSRVACATYVGFALGLVCLWNKNPLLRLCGAIFCVGAAGLLVCVRRAIIQMFAVFCATARKTDMADIPASYEVPLSVDGIQPPPEQGPGGFWIAAIDSPDLKTSEVVSYLGLDYRANADPSSGELRRMIVSMHHRRRRIASLLITAAMEHARHSPPLESLDLETTEFQPGAQKLYENHGFSVVGSRVMRMGPLFSMTVLRFRRRLAE